MNSTPRKSPRHPEPRTIARTAAVALLAAAVVGAPAAAHAKPVDRGYGSGVRPLPVLGYYDAL